MEEINIILTCFGILVVFLASSTKNLVSIVAVISMIAHGASAIPFAKWFGKVTEEKSKAKGDRVGLDPRKPTRSRASA